MPVSSVRFVSSDRLPYTWLLDGPPPSLTTIIELPRTFLYYNWGGATNLTGSGVWSVTATYTSSSSVLSSNTGGDVVVHGTLTSLNANDQITMNGIIIDGGDLGMACNVGACRLGVGSVIVIRAGWQLRVHTLDVSGAAISGNGTLTFLYPTTFTSVSNRITSAVDFGEFAATFTHTSGETVFTGKVSWSNRLELPAGSGNFRLYSAAPAPTAVIRMGGAVLTLSTVDESSFLQGRIESTSVVGITLQLINPCRANNSLLIVGLEDGTITTTASSVLRVAGNGTVELENVRIDRSQIAYVSILARCVVCD